MSTADALRWLVSACTLVDQSAMPPNHREAFIRALGNALKVLGENNEPTAK